MCVATRNRKKVTQNPYFGDLRSFKVISVDTFKKLSLVLVIIRGCLCLSATVFMLDEAISVK